MKIFFEPVNTNIWNIFENVCMPDYTETFLAVKSMEPNDVVLMHVGAQDKRYSSGIYAVGTVMDNPFLLQENPKDYCYGKLTVHVKFNKMTKFVPFVTHEQCKEYIHQFRTPHIISEEFYPALIKMIESW